MSLRRYSRKRAPQGWGPGCRGRYRVERLMAEHCDAKLRDLLQTLADCPKCARSAFTTGRGCRERASGGPSKRTMRLSDGRLCGDGGSGGLRRGARRRRSKRSGIGLMERPRSRSVADPGCYIRTPDHLSVLVTAFLRLGKPRSELKPSVRLERAAEAHRRARARDCRSGVYATLTTHARRARKSP